MQILIIGAGISGLFACKKLHEQGHNVKILEAKNRIGGRILSKGFGDESIENMLSLEMGAEEIHGEKSDWYKLLDGESAKLKKSRQKQDFYFWEKNGKKQLFSENQLESENQEYQKLVEFYENDFYHAEIDDETTVLELTQKHNLSPDAILHLDTWLSNAYGANIDTLKVKQIRIADKLWDAGSKNFMLEENSFSQFLIYYFKDILPFIHFEKNIIQIDYTSPNKILVSTPQNEIWETDKVIISVPVSILKNKRINFLPPLPDYKLKALENIDMKKGIKVALKFKTPFWKKNMGSIFTTLGEYYPATRLENTLMFLGIDKKANNISENTLINDLCNVFNTQIPLLTFQKAIIQDWGKEPFVEGAYSFTTQNAKKTRQQLAKNIDNRIFFIGEATDIGCPATVQGAMYSGLNLEIE